MQRCGSSDIWTRRETAIADRPKNPVCVRRRSGRFACRWTRVVMRDRARYALHRIEKAYSGWRGGRGLALPEFLGIGAQKCGTTWLHENLARHPDLFLPAGKELHYFDWHFRRPLRWYCAQFAPGAGKVRGEITPNYCTLAADRIAFIRRIMPEVRLIFLMRNPVERAWSQAVMNLAEKTGRSSDEVPDEEFHEHFHDHRSILRGAYLDNLDRWLRFFPEHQLYCGFFESIVERPRSLLEDILRFLGVSLDVDWNLFPAHRVVRKGVDAAMPQRHRVVLEQLYREDIQQLHQRFGDPVARWRVR